MEMEVMMLPIISNDLNIILTKTDKQILEFLEKYHSLTLKQISNIFFANKYNYAVRRMLKLQKASENFKNQIQIHSAFHKKTKEKVYYSDYILSEHDSKVFDIYSKVHELGGYVRKFQFKPEYLNGIIEADAYMEFEYKGNLYIYIIEIDYNHFTSPKKFRLYEKLYKDNILQPQCHGVFPYFIVIRDTNDDIRYNSQYFDIYYLDSTLSKFQELVLGII